MIDGALVGADLLGDQGKGRLGHGQQKGQVIVPEVPVEPVPGRQVQQTMDLVQNLRGQYLSVIVSAVELTAYIRQPHQDAVLSDLPVNDQF